MGLTEAMGIDACWWLFCANLLDQECHPGMAESLLKVINTETKDLISGLSYGDQLAFGFLLLLITMLTENCYGNNRCRGMAAESCVSFF